MSRVAKLQVSVLALLSLLGWSPAAAQTEQAAGFSPLPQVEKRGAGPKTLLLIPCASCGWWAFDTFMERNAERYTMYAVTLPGYGGTAMPALPLNTSEAIWHKNAVEALSRLIDQEKLKEVTVVGHSFGGIIALELAARREDVVVGLVNLDGGITSSRSWFHDDPADRRRAADQMIEQQTARLSDPMNWWRFNSATILDPDRRMLYHGMFMATPRDAMLQYWRENFLVDLNPLLSGLRIPVLEVKAISPTSADPETARTQHLEVMKQNGAPTTLRTIFFYETFHHMLEQRPALVDETLAKWLGGGEVADFRPQGYTERVTPVSAQAIESGRLSAYLGSYITLMGTYTFKVHDGKLLAVRLGRETPLAYAGDNTFVYEANPRLKFEFAISGGQATGFVFSSPGKGLLLRGTRSACSACESPAVGNAPAIRSE